MNQRTADRLFPVLLALLIAAGTFFGLAPFVVPTQFAAFFGFSGVDLLPTLLDLFQIPIPDDIEGMSHAATKTASPRAAVSAA